MRQDKALLSLLPGFAPILIYIVVDSFFGEVPGLVAGILLGLAEFTVILIREKRADTFTLADTVLLVLMGAVSLALSDPVFFKLKSAVSGGAISIILIAGSVGPKRLFLPYLENKLGMGTMPKAVADRTLRMLAGFGFLTLAHSALTAVAALYWTKAAWNFVAGALFWLLALGYTAAWMLHSFLAARKARNGGGAISKDEGAGEILPIVDEEGRVVGKAPRPSCHRGGDKPLHPVVRLWLSDGKNGFWMQKRATGKLVQPGKWDCAVGGHVAFGETVEAALRRETREEIGLVLDEGADSPLSARPLIRFVWESELERELVFVFAADWPSGGSLRTDPKEADEVRFWTFEEIKAELEKKDDCGLTVLAREELKRLSGNHAGIVQIV